MFAGSMVALVTPMKSDRSIDFSSLEALVDWHLSCGTDALVILGTTGESSTISDQEREKLIKLVVARSDSRIPVIVGTGTNNTAQSVTYTQQAMSLGADGCLVVTPYYNRPSQEGLYQHFSAIAQAANFPQILYNVPSRTASDLSVDVIIRLARAHANIIGVKDASADFSRVVKLRDSTELSLYSGDDMTALEWMSCGGRGVISVTANIAPQAMHDMCEAALSQDMEKAREMNQRLLPWHELLFIESNPVPAKWVLQQIQMIASGMVRLPLVIATEAAQKALMEQLERCEDIIKGRMVCD